MTRSLVRIVAIPVLILLGIAALLVTGIIGGAQLQFQFTGDPGVTAAAVAALLTMVASFRSIGEYHQGLMYTALGCLAWGAGSAITNSETSVSNLLDIGFCFISTAALVLAVLAFGRVNRKSSHHRTRGLSLLPLILALAVINWTLVAGPIVNSTGALSIDLAESLVHALGTLIVLTVVIAGLSNRESSGRDWARSVVLVSIGLLTLSESLWNNRDELQFGISTPTYELVAALSFLLIAGSAVMFIFVGRRVSEISDDAHRSLDSARTNYYLQFGALASLIVLSSTIRLVDESAPYSALISDLAALSILFFIVARQSLVFRGERQLETQIGELSEQLDSLVSQVGRDPLTGLLNHRAVHERLDLELLGGRAGGESVAIVLIDVDNFKSINDTLGHQAGDRVLRAVSTILISACRGTDVAARYAGDEFMLILPGLDERHAGSVCERIAAEVRRLNNDLHLGGGVFVTLSIGVAVTHSCERNVVQNIAIADAAMYDAKESGKNQVVVVNADTLQISPSQSSGPTVDQLMAESRGLFEWENDGILAG